MGWCIIILWGDVYVLWGRWMWGSSVSAVMCRDANSARLWGYVRNVRWGLFQMGMSVLVVLPNILTPPECAKTAHTPASPVSAVATALPANPYPTEQTMAATAPAFSASSKPAWTPASNAHKSVPRAPPRSPPFPCQPAPPAPKTATSP